MRPDLVESAVAERVAKIFARAGLADKSTFKHFIAPLRHIDWVVHCKAPFAGPEQVLRYLSRYTHRVAISNRRLVAAAAEVTLPVKLVGLLLLQVPSQTAAQSR